MGAFSNMDYELQNSEAAVSDAFTEETPKEAMAIPRICCHFAERISFNASAISIVCPGSAL